MEIWLVKRYWRVFEERNMEIVDAFMKKEDAEVCELNLSIRYVPTDPYEISNEYVVEPLEVKL